MFWCRLHNAGENHNTYLWRARTPTSVTPYVVPEPIGGVPGDFELKCSVALFTKDGVLRTYGGDVPNLWFPPGSQGTGNQLFYGVPYVYEFDPFSPTPGWSQVSGPAGQMNTDRWYCSAAVLHDDRIVVVGDGQQPHGSQGVAPNSHSYDLFQNGQWESSTLENAQYRSWDTPSPCYPTAIGDFLLGGHYPRLRLLASTGQLMWVDGWFGDLYSGGGGGQLTAYMDLDVVASKCPTTDLLPQYRWEIGRPSTGTGSTKWPYGHVAHIVTYNQQGTINDVVYRVTGADRASCAQMMMVDSGAYYMDDPVPGDNQDWTPVGNPITPRAMANLVVLSDGSLFLTGGYHPPTDTILVSSERFEPIQLFPTSTQIWEALPDQSVARHEHAVSLLLPDGSVWVAGGMGDCVYDHDVPKPSWHSYQIYRPAYQFGGPGSRPEILDVGGPWGYGGPLPGEIVVSYGTGAWPQPEIARVALIRNGASTHHDDQQQRYIDVPILTQAPGPGSTREITVLMPPNQEVAPQGYYMLVVIGEGGRPSAGRFVKL